MNRTIALVITLAIALGCTLLPPDAPAQDRCAELCAHAVEIDCEFVPRAKCASFCSRASSSEREVGDGLNFDCMIGAETCAALKECR